MAADFGVTWTERRRPAEEDICPVEVKSFRTDGGTDVFWTGQRSETASTPGTERLTDDRQQVTTSASGEETVAIETSELSDDEMGRLDIDLDRKSRELNLTSSNVRAILHEVITHERVVAMMKAAIRDTQDLPMFEAKMTRSRLKQAVQQGQPLNWSLSALNTVKPPQFVDIDLEEDEDSSDEEYCPDEDEEEEEDTESFLSDGDSLASPPRMQLASKLKPPADQRAEESLQRCPAHLRTSTCCPQQLLSAPIESSFMERLKAVEEELDCSPAYTYGQSLDRKRDDDNDDGGDEGFSCLAYRTRSKLPLVNIPLGQLEAELLAPDITADMYDQSHAQREEDRHWTRWLQSLMAPDCEDEADDDDDPEYNFVEDLDEPDMEDYRTDRAVQITKKEVNELLEELFDTLKDEDLAAEEEEEEHEEEEAPPQTGPKKFNVPQALRFEAPLASMLTERRQTVRKRYEALQQRRALQDTTNQLRNNTNAKDTPSNNIASVIVLPSWTCPSLHLDYTQRLQLQQQIQQHVQLLTQVHLLSRRVDALNHEACITKHYLEELQHFARRREDVRLRSSFRVCNLQGALDLLQEEEQRAEPPPAPPAPPAPALSRRWLPRMTPATNSHAFPLLPADTAWLFATRSVFLYPELLPVCSLDPALHSRHHRSVYTAGEDGLIVLGLKHFEGSVHSDQLISSYLLCKSRWNFRKHVREMSSSRGPRHNIIKTFLTQGVVPPLPLACSRVQPEDWRPPVDRNTSNIPNWLKNSQQIIQKTRLDSTCYPPTLPPGCALRLHPYWLNKSSRPPPRPHRRLFTLAHNASLLPLAKAQTDRQPDIQPISYLSVPSPGVSLLSDPPAVPAGLPLAPAPVSGSIQLASVHPVSSHPDVIQPCRPVAQNLQQNVSEQECLTPIPFLLPLPSLSSHNTTNPIMPCSDTVVKPSYFLLQMVWPPPPPTTTSQHALGYQQPRAPVNKEHEEENNTNPRNTPARVRQRQEWEEKSNVHHVSLDGGENSGGEEQRGEETDGGGDREEEGGEDGEEGEEDREERGGEREDGGGERENGGGEREDGAEDEEDGGGEREDGGGEREDDGDKDRDEDQDRQGEEEEDFDDLTQDEDEEEVMSSASEESVLSVPELQETMKQLTWLAAERRLCADGDSEEDHSPTSPGSQEEEEEEEEEGPKGEESVEGRSSKVDLDEETPSGERTPRGGGRCPGRGRGRSRPHRSLKRSRQERHSKDAAKLLLLYDENILDNDPHRESKDVAFAQSYLNRVRDALQDVPEQMEEFVSLLNEFEQVGEGEELLLLYRKLRCILGNRVDLLRDFAAFLHPEQALQCGLLEEQQAFERSRRFLRQLEISFGDNPSHYQKIIKALQTGPDLSSATIQELKTQMATLLKGHTHLQAEFWVFFDELRPPPARPGQFEEAHWPEEGGGGSDGGEGVGQVMGVGACGGFEEVTLPELEEEEEGLKSQPMTNRRQRRKMDGHRNYKDRDWSDKHWSCLCPDAKIRHHRRKECPHCHGNKTSGGVSRAMKSLDPLYSQISSAHDEPGDKDLDLKGGDDSPQPDRSGASWEGPFPLTDEKEEEEELDDEEGDEEEEERKIVEKEQGLMGKRMRREEAQQPPSITCSVTSTCSSVSSSSPSACTSSTASSSIPAVSPSVTTFPITSFITSTTSSSTSSVSPSVCTSPSLGSSSSAPPPRPSPPPDLPVCAKNISLTASGEKVILWTREADRVILTTCQQDGANQDTFQAISSLLGNKTPTEVSRRFRDLMRLFRTSARQTSSEDEAPPTETATANEAED